MKCQVTSQTTRKVMISREVKVPRYEEICVGEKIRAHLVYNSYYKMIVKNNKLLKTPPRDPNGENRSISQFWEVLTKFFSLHNIEPIWHNCNLVFGHYDKEQGAWTGCMGKV